MAVKSYKKGNAVQLSTNFDSTEFDCHGSGCCSLTLIDEKLVKYLQKIRDHFGKPVNVSSAYRCSSHNKNVGGVTGSRHTRGEAADIYINGVAPAEIAKYAESIGILGIGLYETNADGFFVHVDTRTSKSFWYGQSEKYRSTFGGTAIKEENNSEVPKEGVKGQMKYSKSNPPLVCMQKNSTCYKGTREMTVKGVLWHSTGANNPTLKRYVQPGDNDSDRAEMLKLLGKNSNGNDWNHISVQAGLNAWIGELANGDVASIQTMPWDYRPWGCGSGNNGSCNNGWIQFEICEDGLSDKTYFNAVYKEACELTAYLCKLYDLDPKGTAKYNNLDVPVILCHADSCKLGLGSNHGDVLHWFKKHGKTMDDVRADVAKLMAGSSAPVASTPSTPKEEEKVEKQTLYRVRKTWGDAASQKGAFKNLDSAKELADKNPGYYVFDESGKVIYPEVKVETPAESGFKIGDAAKIKADATYASGTAIPNWIKQSKVYVRDIRDNGDIVFSTVKTGAVTGVIKPKYLIPYTETEAEKEAVLKEGAVISLSKDAKYADGSEIPGWVIKSKLYAREIRRDGNVVISTQATGAITGVVHQKYIVVGT